MSRFFDNNIEFLKGVGPLKAEILNKELGIFTFGDLLEHYPFRYEDRTAFLTVADLSSETQVAQIKGKLRSKETLGEGSKKRIKAVFTDNTGMVELLFFQSLSYFDKYLSVGGNYIIYGKPQPFGGTYSFTHPEIELYTPEKDQNGFFQPIYSLTEKLRKKFIDSKAFSLWFSHLLPAAYVHFNENLPVYILEKYRLISKPKAFEYLHLPKSFDEIIQAQRRLKFEELFYNQLKLLSLNLLRKHQYAGQIFNKTGLLTEFYKNHIPFDLTQAQKRVVHQIFEDLKSGKQMNRLIQGDVGSGKTIVAFISMLIGIDGGSQCVFMAPTEILAQQHYAGLLKFSEKIGVTISLLTGSTKKKEREPIHQNLKSGELKILVGTHAVLEDIVQFSNLGLCVIDEQHRFGVAQRAKLWAKNPRIPPHIMVMTATPIPRTLAMTLYGDLDVSEIDELPPGRKPIITKHKFDSNRLIVFQFIRDELALGRQVYIVYPLIEESEKSDLKDLTDGYFSITRAFPEYAVAILHGKMKPAEKEMAMKQFKTGIAKILVATTVIEVGVDVPNASIMVIENAERFGLSQLHQLRGRVGRGAEQSYCILMTTFKLSKDSQVRMETMVRTQNGFEISKVDLELRGPGDMAGTAQSGIVDLKIANLAKDEGILKVARENAIFILENDGDFVLPEHTCIKYHLSTIKNKDKSWSRIS